MAIDQPRNCANLSLHVQVAVKALCGVAGAAHGAAGETHDL